MTEVWETVVIWKDPDGTAIESIIASGPRTDMYEVFTDVCDDWAKGVDSGTMTIDRQEEEGFENDSVHCIRMSRVELFSFRKQEDEALVVPSRSRTLPAFPDKS